VYVGLSLVVGIAVSFGTVGGPVVREEVVQVSGLPEGLDGLRIANIGDVHVGPFIKPADLAAAVDLVNARKVDLLAITGDLIDDLNQLEPTLEALERSEALPVLSILGNHDKYPNEAAIVAALKRRNPRIEVLINNSILIHPRGVPLRVAGVDYPLAADGRHMLPRDEQDAAMRRFAQLAFAQAEPGEPLVVLSHHPEFFSIAARHGAMLTLSSHTHGGQVRLFGRPVIVAYDYMHGIYCEGEAYLDVNSGLGHWLPLRIGVPREISIVTLRRG
jgi:predicted MPP superfamily phosphohydrolase